MATSLPTAALSASPDGIIHAPWCTSHQADPTPAEGWCNGDLETIAGVRTQLTGGLDGRQHIFVGQLDEPNEVSPAAAERLAARLSDLARQASTAGR